MKMSEAIARLRDIEIQRDLVLDAIGEMDPDDVCHDIQCAGYHLVSSVANTRWFLLRCPGHEDIEIPRRADFSDFKRRMVEVANELIERGETLENT